MKFKRRAREELELNLTPLIDVVFLLLIFFMVSTTFQKESEISLQLPRASTEPPEAVPDKLEVVIDASGAFYVNDQELLGDDVEALQAALYELAGGDRERPVTIRADAQTPHQAVVTAMDAAARLGMLRLSIANVALGRLTDRTPAGRRRPGPSSRPVSALPGGTGRRACGRASGRGAPANARTNAPTNGPTSRSARARAAPPARRPPRRAAPTPTGACCATCCPTSASSASRSSA